MVVSCYPLFLSINFKINVLTILKLSFIILFIMETGMKTPLTIEIWSGFAGGSPECQQQLLGMWSWLRARKAVLKAELRDISQMENECTERLDQAAGPFHIPAKQQSLPLSKMEAR